MIYWIKEVTTRNIGSRSFDACLNQLKKSLQDQPSRDGIKFLDLSPNLHHAPRLNKDANEDSKPHGEQDKTSCLTQTHHHHHRQDRHLHADSKHLHHLLAKTRQLTGHSDRDWIAANVEKVRYDSMKILGLSEGATEGEVKAAYQAMSRIYHPEKHNSGFTGKSDEEAVEFF
jgi:hypothetical protein